MNERIKELAEQAGFEYSSQWTYWTAYEQDLERFSELVRKDEREACAQLCENVVSNEGYVQAKYCAAAIRARGDKHD